MPEEHPQSIAEQHQRIIQLYQQGQYEAAIELARSVRECLALDSTNPRDLADTLTFLALIYAAKGDNSTAQSLYQQVMEQLDIAPADNSDLTDNITRLAFFYTSEDSSKIPQLLGQQALEIRRKERGDKHLDVADSLTHLALFHTTISDYTKAERLYQQAQEIYCNSLGNQHPYVITCLNNRVQMYEALGQLPEAAECLEQVLAVERATLGENDPEVAMSSNNLAGLYRELGNYQKALPYQQKALEIERQMGRENHSDYATYLNNLGMLYRELGNYQEAETLLQKALDIERRNLGNDDPELIPLLNNLVDVRAVLGKYAESEPLLQRVLEIERQTFGENHPEYANSLNNLAGLYRNLGRYDPAQSLYYKSLQIREQTMGEEHPSTATCLSSLAVLYRELGNYEKARQLHQQVLKIERQAGRTQESEHAVSLSNLAGVYQATGNYAEAELLYQQALDLLRQLQMEHHPEFASSLNNLASLYDRLSKYSEAETLFKEALTIIRAVFSERHPQSAMALSNLATHYLMVGNYTASEPLLNEALKIQRDNLGENHPQYAVTLGNLAELCASTHRYTEALEWSQQVEVINDKMLGEVFAIGSERRRMAYLAKLQTQFEAFISLIICCLSHYPAVAQIGMELVLRRKGIRAESLAAQRDAVLGGWYPTLRPKLEELTTLRRQIAQKTLAGPSSSGGLQEHQHSLAEWNIQKEQLEIQLARQIPEMKLQQKLQETNWREIAEKLPKHAVLVEFVRSRFYDFETAIAQMESKWKPARYFAFILSANQSEKVEILDLGEAEPINHLIAGFRASITGEGNRREFEPVHTEFISGAIANKGLALRHSIFDPLLDVIGDRQRLFLAPDGDLNKLPFEVLPTDDGNRLIDKYQISYLGTARDALRFGVQSKGKPTEPLVIADPDFDFGSEEATEQYYGKVSRDFNQRALNFQPLPGTRKEGEQIAKMLNVEPWLKRDVLEARLKAKRSPRILHIATHGFFLKDQKQDFHQEYFGDFDRLSGANLENPLLRSGLALAGANTWLKKSLLPPEAEDGILTAEDVSGLDLLDTELVVLSACETGLGEVQTGEGVFGLRRAFVLAGAKTLVMSLWKVPDKQTEELITDYYHRILAGKPRGEALRLAQLEMKKKYPNPLYWGAFICQGEANRLPQ